MLLCVFLSVSCVCAEDNQTCDDVMESSQEELVLESSQGDVLSDDVGGNSTDSDVADVKASFSPGSSNVVKGNSFSVTLKDENGSAISNHPVYFTVGGVTSNVTTDSKGVAKLQMNQKEGTYTVKYLFNQTGYKKVSGSTKVLVLSTTKSQLKANDYTAYYKFKNTFVVTLTVGGVKLANRNVKLTIHSKTYTQKTDSNGKARFAIGLAVGKYSAKYSYAGEKNIKASSGKAVVTVKKMSVKIKKANSVIFRDKTLNKFKVKLVDARGNPVANKNVKFTINKKTYSKKTDKNGVAYVNIKLAKGIYKLKVTSSKGSNYEKASKEFSVKVKSKNVKNGGIWLFSYDMKNVNFKNLKKLGYNNIFLNFAAVKNYGKSYVESFIQKGLDNGIKTHLWMQVFYKGGKWIYPVKNGKIKYDVINDRIKEAKSYAKIKGVAGIHFDYLRFPGNAYKYKNGVAAVNYFTKEASKQIHKINSKLIVSAAVMPEPSSMKYYYGQDIPTMSKYLDVIIPMVYKGNYHAGTSWIKSTTSQFVKMSNGAKIWTGLQTYKSDSDVTRLSASSLLNDADYAGFGGATGIVLFRFGLVNLFNFKEA